MANTDMNEQSAQQQDAGTTLTPEVLEEMTSRLVDQGDVLTPDQQEVGQEIVKLFAGKFKTLRIDRSFFESSLEAIDQMISKQLDEVLHNEKFQKLESAWRGLSWMVSRTDFGANIRINVLNASKQQLLEDFQDAVGDTTTTGLYQHIYQNEYGAPGGQPIGGMVLNYQFSHGQADVALLSKVAEVANMAHAPVITGVSPDLLGPKGFEHLTDSKYSVSEALASGAHAKWNGLREDENSKYIGMALPHFLLRTPYNSTDHPEPTKSFKYDETIGGKNTNYCWGNAAYAFASRLTDSFKRYKWCWRIVGEEDGGAIEDMNTHIYEENGEQVQKPPTDVALAFRKEEELTEAGLVPLMWMKKKDFSVIYRAPSFKKPLKYPDTPEGNRKEADDKIRTKLPYVFILTRFAHYIKRLQTKYIGKPISRTAIQKELDDWIRQYVNATDTPMPGTLGPKPLRAASVVVEEDKKNPGVYMCDFKITPHTLTEGFNTTLSLVTRQDTN